MHKLRLGVNIDHVATIRNARAASHPDPLRAAILAQEAGADGITAHLREDRRHISEKDISLLKKNISIPLNLEIAATEEMLNIALETKPNAACIVPEKRQEITTEGGLDLTKIDDKIYDYIEKLSSSNIRISLFIDPDIKQIDLALNLKADIVELHTGSYCNTRSSDDYNLLVEAAKYAHEKGLEVHAGHGIDYSTVKDIAKIEQLVELNIGHFLIGESIYIGLYSAIKKMRDLMDSVR